MEESPIERRAGQGRPLGLLLAWLAEAGRHATAGEHVHAPDKPLFEARAHHRELNRGVPGMRLLWEAERPCRLNEGEEPELVP